MEKKCKIIYLNNFIYILSDDEIKEGDWTLCLDETDSTVMNWNINQCVFKHVKGGNCTQCKKIISTTDTNLNLDIFDKKTCKGDKDCRKHCDCLTLKYKELPQPSQQFITKYIEEYNKGSIIKEIMVEYEEY